MKVRLKIWVLMCLLVLTGVWLFWPSAGRQVTPANVSGAAPAALAAKIPAAPAVSTNKTASLIAASVAAMREGSTNRVIYQLTNSRQPLKELQGSAHAILLQNALIDTESGAALNIPSALKSAGDPGAYIVQARGVIDARFRELLKSAGAQIGPNPYIPNNAYLVELTPAGASALRASALVQAVLPYEPYYKLQPSLLGLAVNQLPLPPGTALTLGLFTGDPAATQQKLTQLGAKIIGTDQSPFGPVVRVLAPDNWTALAQVPGVQLMEPVRQRKMANDLARVTLGISTDTVAGTTNDWLGLSGQNVTVEVNDSGIDATHPDLTGRVFFDTLGSINDTAGHGTHVAGIIASSGVNSISPPGPTDVGAAAQGSVSGADFRGKAPLADLYSVGGITGHDTHPISDQYLQAAPATNSALISNNSWGYDGDFEYDLAASSFDAASRDALPYQTGSQPVLFVFAAGNSGGGDNAGGGGSPDTINSPGTAKNVITVGSVEQFRNLTNIVTDAQSNQAAIWMPESDSGAVITDAQVARYSARGNVGVGTEGAYGRFKPDVVAPGSWVVSTRSSMWDTNAYYNPTNVAVTHYIDQTVATNDFQFYTVSVPANAISVTISITPNKHSNPFPADLPVYVQQSGYPDPVNAPGSIDITTQNDGVAIPPASGGAITGIQSIQGNGFYFAVGNSTNTTVNYDLTVAIATTNNVGDLYQVLEAMNEKMAPYYRYESGTSMAAPAISGVLALIQDYFTNTLHLTPSPALLKAMIINGSRLTGSYNYAVTNGNNFEGWGLANIANTLPLTNNAPIAIGPSSVINSPLFIMDQSPTNALATGDSHTYLLTVNTNSDAQYLYLQATLVWTDPPGDPAAAIKLVNNLDLVITNLDTGEVYVGNDLAPGLAYNLPVGTNAAPNFDTINNVENIVLPPLLGGNYSVTVIGRAVNVNAVTQHPDNVAQDYALVVAVGEGEVADAISSVADAGITSLPTSDQLITYVATTNQPLFNQFAGENSPLLGTNTLPLGSNTVWGSTGVLTVGQTNQWHFYVVTNNALNASGGNVDVTNAAFITFDAATLSVPRMGALQDTLANATRPEADIDLYVSTDSSITNLNPVAIANCLAGTVVSTANSFGASLGQGGTEFVVFSNSAPGQVYYVGVKSEDREAAEYAFMPIFTSEPFSVLDQNGNQVVRGLLLPVNIPDGSNTHPGFTNVFALATFPMTVQKVVVTNLDEHENFGDLVGTLTHSTTAAVLNNHAGLGNTYGTLPLVYDDSRNPVAGSQRTDGPGSLTSFRAKSGIGPWILGALDDSYTHTGRVSDLTLLIQPHRDLREPGITFTLPPGGFFVDYVDVPPGYTNLTFYATNLPPYVTPPVEMFEKFGNDPTLTDYDQRADLTNGVPPGNDISVGPPLAIGRYFIGIYNPSTTMDATIYLSATLGIDSAADTVFNYASTNGPENLLDDAVTDSQPIFVAATQQVASVNVGIAVKTPRISDLTFTLVSPDGTRVLLMENRGGTDTNGAGGEFVYTNVVNSTAAGGAAANTNSIDTGTTFGSLPITYNFYTAPDEMTVYYGTNPATFYAGSPYLLYDTGLTNNPSLGPGAQNTAPATFTVNYPGAAPGSSTYLTIIMNQFGTNNSRATAWNYTAGAVVTNFQYLVFTSDTNLSTVPIKFAAPPFSFTEVQSNYTLCDFESATNGLYRGYTNIYDPLGGWTVPTNLTVVSTALNITNQQFYLVTNVVTLTNNYVSVVTDPFGSLGGDGSNGSNYLALAKGTITRSIPTVPGRTYNVNFWYRGPGISSWWRGEGNGSDSSDPETLANNGTLVGRFNFPAGEVGQAFQLEDSGDMFGFAGTNTYVQARQNASLDVGRAGGFTVEGWINPTNLVRPQPLVEWLAATPTNTADTNLVIAAGPYLNPNTGHYYYLLGATNWTVSETWAQALGGHLATINTANEQNWVFDNFAAYGTLNRNLWIGLTNTVGTTFGWVGGQTNVTYTNWLASQPLNNNNTFRDYTFMFGSTNLPAGLWTLANNNGYVQGSLATNIVYGVVEVDDLQTNGVQFWVSVTNTPGTTNVALVNSNGCLYANIVDTNFVSHEIYSAPGLLQSNVYQHVALTYDTNSGIANLYLNGTNVASTNFGLAGVLIPKTDGDVLLGRDMSRYTNNYYGGKMDEMSIYRRALSPAELLAIYQTSAFATNGLTGKFDPAVVPAYGLAEAQVDFGGVSNVIFGINNQWSVNSYTFTATTNTMPLTITGVGPGILLDEFSVAEAPLTNLYYLPEEDLGSLAGVNANGNWSLQVWDNRAGAAVTNLSQLLNWQLSLVLQSNATFAASIPAQSPLSATVPSGQTVYFTVPVPSWAQSATNILVSSSQPVDLLFNPTNPPTGSNPGDLTLLTASTAGVGTPDISVNQPQPFTQANQAGSSYILGVRNNSAFAASVVLQVDYDILALTNGVPYTSVLNTNDSVRYFSFNVSSNAQEATFQLLQLSGNADLVVRKGVPLPDLTNTDYGSFNATNLDENIYVTTNSMPVPLSAGTWYLGVFKRSSGALTNTILAKELDATNSYTVIDLTNGVPFNWTAGPGAALTNFFRFHATNEVVGGVTNYIQGLQFLVYNLTGNGDLTVQTNVAPLVPPFFQTSQNPGRNPEVAFIFTNSALTNLEADWYLGVPNHESNMINYTIVAAIMTNSYFPAFPGAEGAGGGAVGSGHASPTQNSMVYHVTSLADSGPGTLRDAVSATNRTVVFDVTGTINLLSPLVITNSYLTIAGQSAMCDGITVAGQMTTVQSAHDVVIRSVRFRPGNGAPGDSLGFLETSNVIADHVSAAWSANNLVSVLNSTNVTVQWSIMADSLYLTNSLSNGLGSLLRYGNGLLSFNHNLYADNYTGNPQVGDNLSLDFVNNVIYNWGTFSGLTGGTNDLLVSTNGCTNSVNYVCNYLIAGPDTALFATNYSITNIAFFGGGTNALAANWIFQTNNFIDSDTNRVLNGADTKWAMFTNDYTRFQQRFPLVPVSTDEAFIAYEKVLDFAGVNMCQRDAADTNIVTRVRNQTGRLISTTPGSNGMIGWWRGDGNTVDSVVGNNGTLVNAGYTNGVVNQAFSFDPENYPYGTYNALQIADQPAYELTNALTIEGWVRPRGDGYVIFFRGDHRPGLDPYSLSMQGNSNIDFAITDALGNSATVQTSLAYDQWTHVAAVLDGNAGTISIYTNGLLAAQTVTSVRPFGPLQAGQSPGIGIGNVNDGGNNFPFIGDLDEISLYSTALSPAQILAIYQAGSAGKLAALTTTAVTMLPYRDTDQDGVPDFWETTFGQNPTNYDSYLQTTNVNYLGYSDLEEYLAWRAGPHALTVTNTPVGVDLMQLFGQTGNLSFEVTNGINGSVYLTNVMDYTNSLGTVIAYTNTGTFSNSIAVFTPTNTTPDFSGYASFDVYVTNNDTVAHFGPVQVSVVVSAVPITYGSANTNPPVFINGSGTITGQTNDELTLLTVTNTATSTATNLTLTYAVTLALDTNAMSLLGWTNSYANVTNTVPVIDTNGVITWTPSEAQGPGVYTITTVVTDSGLPPLSATNSFSVTVNEVNHAPVLPLLPPGVTNYSIPALNLLTVTNTAQDSDLPLNPLTYSLTVSGGVTNATIDTNGIITWTPTQLQAPGVYTFTTVVTDTNQYALVNQSLSDTNSFTVTVTPVTAPFVFTQPAQAVTGTGAKLNGMVTPNGLPTVIWFEWGTNTSYGKQTLPVAVGNAYRVIYATTNLTGLTLNVPYHYRLVASNVVGVVYGFDQIFDEANVVTWGADYVKQIEPPAGLSNVVAIAGAYDHSIALKNNGVPVAWGDNTFGQANVPANVTNVLAVAGGEYFSMALRTNGTVTAWGANILTQTNVPAGLSNVVFIAGGTYSSLALRTNGAIVAWGATFFGLTNVPPGASNMVSVAGGGFHSLAIKNDGTVIAWGDNSAGQTNVPPGLTNVVAVAGGNYHSLALKSDGTVVSWGDDGAGQTNVPPGLTNVVAIAAGGFHSLALKNNGQIVTWGDNSSGQSSVPPNLTNAVAISSGYFHSLALTPQSLASLTNAIVLSTTNGVADTNTILAGGIIYYQVNVPANADLATNSLLFAMNGPLNLWFTTNTPPTIATNAWRLLGGVTNGVSVLSTSSAPTNIVPGATYYLAVQNTNSFSVSYGLQVDFHLVLALPPAPPISSIIATNIAGTNGFLLTWFAPSNYVFQVQFSDSLLPANWITFTNPLFTSYNTNFFTSPTNTQFNFFDDGSQAPFGPMRFYRLVLVSAGSAANTLTLPAQSNVVTSVSSTVTVTNAATDSNPSAVLSYSLLNPPAGAVIDTNGVITWTNAGPAGIAQRINTLVTDNGSPSASATNTFTVFVMPFPTITNVVATATNTTLSWVAPTNDMFQVQWTTNLAPPVWMTFPNIITSPSGVFTFVDTNAPVMMKFYQLILLP